MDKPLNAQLLGLIYGRMVSATGKGELLHARVRPIKHKIWWRETEKKALHCLNSELVRVRFSAYLTGPITPGVISTASASQLHTSNQYRRETVLSAAVKGENWSTSWQMSLCNWGWNHTVFFIWEDRIQRLPDSLGTFQYSGNPK